MASTHTAQYCTGCAHEVGAVLTPPALPAVDGHDLTSLSTPGRLSVGGDRPLSIIKSTFMRLSRSVILVTSAIINSRVIVIPPPPYV